MEMSVADDVGLEENPRKKIKLDVSTAVAVPGPVNASSPHELEISIVDAEQELAKKEATVGIVAFVSSDAGFQGILKRRYHDFLVNEIMPDGKVVRLDDPEQLKPPQMFPDGNDDHKKEGKKSASTKDTITKEGTNSAQDLQEVSSKTTDTNHGGDKKLEEPVFSVTDHAQISPETQLIYDLSNGGNQDAIHPRIELTDQSFEQLQKYFDMDAIKKLASLFNGILKKLHTDLKNYESVDSLPVDEKDDRRNVHQLIRTVFLGRFETKYEDGGYIRCTASASGLPQKGKNGNTNQKRGLRQAGWNKLLGNFMHFTLYKENRDSSDVLGHMANKLNLRGIKAFDIAGNKDRRAVTVQRISAFKVKADRFLHLNNIIKQAHIGDCCYSQYKLQLGDLAGNEFLITLRDCAVRVPGSSTTTQNPEDIEKYIRQSMQNLRDKGFINYYGLQRFGSFSTRTDAVGQHMLNGDFKAAVDTILEFSPETLEAANQDDNTTISFDDVKRAQAINWFLTKSADSDTILSTLPRRFTAECAIVSFLSKIKDHTKQYRGALESIPRNMRSLYPHAYQSLIWNLAASYRWNLAPGKLLPGDLILVSNPAPQADASDEVDPIYAPNDVQNDTESIYALTEQDIATGRYTIFDIVLPQPGHSIKYPSFMLSFYKSTMQEHGGLDPENMHRQWRDVSLPGTYRKLLGRPFDGWGFEQVRYHDPEAKMALTDWEKLEMKQQGKTVPQTASGIVLAEDIAPGDRLAILLRFQLSSSTYATMALRELMKSGPVEYRPDFSGGRTM